MMTDLRRAEGRHAALQVRRQPHPHHGAERAARHEALRVPLRLPRLLGGGAGADSRTELNTNDFHFDTEIIIQLLNAGLRIVELPIPTYYGDEICRVNGLKYAKDVMLATVKNAFHRAGVLYQRRFDPKTSGQDNEHYDLEARLRVEPPVRPRRVPAGGGGDRHRRGPGGVAKELAKKGCEVAVVDQYAPTEHDPGVTVAAVQSLDAPPAFDTSRVPGAAAARRHRAPEGARALPRAAALAVHLRAEDGGAQHAQRRLHRAAADAAVRASSTTARPAFSIAPTRGCSPSAPSTTCCATPGFRVREVKGVPAPFPKVFGDGPLGLGAAQGQRARDRRVEDAVQLPDPGGRRDHARRAVRPRSGRVAAQGRPEAPRSIVPAPRA